jgi:hypothetical protein
VRAEEKQSPEEDPPERPLAELAAHQPASRHAEERRRERGRRSADIFEVKSAASRERRGQRDGGDGEGKPNVPRYGTAGMANTPVAAVRRPVSAPTKGPSHHSADGATEKRTEVRPIPA